MITTMSYSELRQKLKWAFDSVCDSRTPLRITRRNGEHLVVLPESEYDALEETAYLLRSPANAQKILTSMKTERKNMTVFKDVDEIKHAIGF